VIKGEGRAHPVDIVYPDQIPAADVVESVVSGVGRAFADRDGDLLAFLPGSGEIRRARERLQRLLGERALVLPLHGDLPLSEQEIALCPRTGPPRRVVLATDIAETSITIEGVSTVVDCGLTRKPRFDPGSGLSRLITEPVSRASADQRAGRAGRLEPGVCYRLWSKAQEVGRPEHRPAEILHTDLAPLALELALWGTRDPSSLAWLDPPPAGAWTQGVSLLKQLGALDESGTITALGRRMAAIPIHPRLARMLAAADDGSSRQIAADIAALLSDRDPWIGATGLPRPADIGLRIHALEQFRESGRSGEAEHRRLAAADRLSRRLIRRTGEDRTAPAREPGALLALAYPDRVAKRRPGEGGRYLLAGGPGGALPANDPLSAHELLVVADMDDRARDGRIRLALPISKHALREVLGNWIETANVVSWDTEREVVRARREERFGNLVLTSRAQPTADPEQATPLLLEQVGKGFDNALGWTTETRQLQARVALMRRLEPDGRWPDLSDDWLRNSLDAWLGPWLTGKLGLSEVRALDLQGILLSLLDWEGRRHLEEQVPTALVTPAGNRRRLDYTAGVEPVLAVPLQEMFGASETPTICNGRVAVTLQLLSPARRPVQVTRDLAGFWGRGYADVRKELRGRYPKHHWPEDPARSEAVAGGVKRRKS